MGWVGGHSIIQINTFIYICFYTQHYITLLNKSLVMWKAFSDKYEVSSLGYVRNIKTSHILKGDLNSKGYLRVSLSGKRYFIHRLIAILYVPNPLNLLQVNHKDLDKTNNNSNNLEWCTNDYNTEHSYLNGRLSGNTKLSTNDVLSILSSKLSTKQLAKLYNVAIPTIYSVKHGLNIKRLHL